MEIRKTAWAEISKGAIIHNLDFVCSLLAPGTAVCAVLKGDAYGLGMIKIKKFLAENKLAEMFACGTIREMEKLFAETDDDSDVLLLGFCPAYVLEKSFVEGRIPHKSAIFSVWNMDQYYELENLAKKLGHKIRLHIRVEEWGSGMGLRYEEYLEHEDEIMNSPCLDVCGIYGHIFSSYDDDTAETERELKVFDAFVGKINPEYRRCLTVHVQNSALVLRFPEYSYDMARVGTFLYGMPFRDGGRIQTVMKICATVFSVKDVDENVPLGYEGTLSVNGKRRIARVMIGYADCPVLLTLAKVKVKIRGKYYFLAEEACMDNLCVDITGNDDIEEGDIAVIMGDEGLDAVDIISENEIKPVHCDWMIITSSRLEKVLVE